MRVLRPDPRIYAFYDGRVEGHRFAQDANWVDEGALSLGIASYAVVDGDEALIYDTHVSVDHARLVRTPLEREGVRTFTVLLSHWHLDHVAGTEAFADCQVLAGRRTAQLLTRHRQAIQEGSHHGPPGIDPLVLPPRVLEGRSSFAVGRLALELIPVDIHSADATVVWLAESRVLLAGDTLEDTLTFVAEPEHLAAHLADLDRLRALAPGADPAQPRASRGDRPRRVHRRPDPCHAALRRPATACPQRAGAAHHRAPRAARRAARGGLDHVLPAVRSRSPSQPPAGGRRTLSGARAAARGRPPRLAAELASVHACEHSSIRATSANQSRPPTWPC